MKQWLTFMVFIFGWSLLGRGILEGDMLRPALLGVGWLVGLVWGAGAIIAGRADATYLVKVTFGFMLACLAVAAVTAIVFS